MSLPSVDKERMIILNAFTLKNNHDCIHDGHDMAKEERKVNKELLQEYKAMFNPPKTLFSVTGSPWA